MREREKEMVMLVAEEDDILQFVRVSMACGDAEVACVPCFISFISEVVDFGRNF